MSRIENPFSVILRNCYKDTIFILSHLSNRYSPAETGGILFRQQRIDMKFSYQLFA